MSRLADKRTANRRLPTTKASVTGLALLGLSLWAGCDSEMAKEFREVATPSLQSGVSAILDGVVDGVFAVVDPDTSASEDSNTSPTAP